MDLELELDRHGSHVARVRGRPEEAIAVYDELRRRADSGGPGLAGATGTRAFGDMWVLEWHEPRARVWADFLAERPLGVHRRTEMATVTPELVVWLLQDMPAYDAAVEWAVPAAMADDTPRPPPCDCRRPAPLKGQLSQYGYFYECAGCRGLVPGYRVGTDGITLHDRPDDTPKPFGTGLPPGAARGLV